MPVLAKSPLNVLTVAYVKETNILWTDPKFPKTLLELFTGASDLRVRHHVRSFFPFCSTQGLLEKTRMFIWTCFVTADSMTTCGSESWKRLKSLWKKTRNSGLHNNTKYLTYMHVINGHLNANDNANESRDSDKQNRKRIITTHQLVRNNKYLWFYKGFLRSCS